MRDAARYLISLVTGATMAMAGNQGIRVEGGPSYPGGKAPPAHVLDDDPATYWAGDPSADEWVLRFDLGSVTHLPAVTVDYYSSRYMAQEAAADVSVDGIGWQHLGAMPVADPAAIDVGMDVRFVRLRFNGKARDKQPAVRAVTFGERRREQLVAQMADITYLSRADGTMQPARAFTPTTDRAVPLVVGLHTWSGDYTQHYLPEIERWCVNQGWAYIHPNFRGPNWIPEATGSDLVIVDILSAVNAMKARCSVDPARIYLVGASGGGYTALLMAGRAPDVWAGVSAWVPISDLAAWYVECEARGLGYAHHIVKSVGGTPGSSDTVDAELAHRSPLTWLKHAGDVPLDINAGIHDGHTGSVPVSHSLLAFNCVVDEACRLAQEDIDTITQTRAIPDHLVDPTLKDPSYGDNPPLFRRSCGVTRVTIFEGGHQIVQQAALEWLKAQHKAPHPTP